MKFTYSSGQRVLDGYTLKRGIGRGGFGEVYYALSDGGKEVALKLVRGHNLEVEMRGMGQCLNLKHPNLMTLIDLRTDAQGDHWVVMEYISGEPLSVVLNRHPQGLPMELAQQWFVALAKAVSCLHDHGIVHRDLKPGNILVENPAHRYVSMLEMAKEVEAAGRDAAGGNGDPRRRADSGNSSPRVAARGVNPSALPAATPVLSALPVVSPRQQVAELCGSMALVPVVAAFFSTLWMSVSSLTVSAKGNVPGTSMVANVGTEIG